MTRARWTDEATTEHELRAARLFVAAAKLPVPPPPSFAEFSNRSSARRAPRVTTLKVVSGLLATAALTLFAGREGPKAARFAVFPAVGPVVLQKALPSESEALAPVPAPEALEPMPVVAAPRAPKPPLPVVPAPRREATSNARRSTLGEEAALIAGALQALRGEKDPARAVTVLATYRARYPDGVLRPEALLVEAQAERALHRADAALVLLDEARPLANEKLRGELELTRGELLAELAQCERAELAFGVALETVSGSLAERAAWGRARCASRRLSHEARPLLEAFLEEYPQSGHAQDARELLDTMPFVK